MNTTLTPDVAMAIRALYDENPHATRLFDWTASLERDADETTVERFMRKLEISRGEAISLARELEEAGCGEFIVGRKGWSSRFRWAYSRVSLGQVASGEAEELEEASDPISEEDEEASEPREGSERHLTIHEAKIRLAQSLGVEPSQISIEIRA